MSKDRSMSGVQALYRSATGQDDVLTSQDDEHPTALRGEVLLGVAALVQQVIELSGGEVLLGDARPAEAIVAMSRSMSSPPRSPSP